MKNILFTAITALAIILLSNAAATAQDQKTIVPVVLNGEAQKIPAFESPDKWIKHDLWVETEFDSDGDGKNDRMHVDVTRPAQTETEGLKLPVIYESSPYFAGTAGIKKEYFWDVRQELDQEPPVYHKTPPPINREGKRPVISTITGKDMAAIRIHCNSFICSGNRAFTGMSHHWNKNRSPRAKGCYRLAERKSQRIYDS